MSARVLVVDDQPLNVKLLEAKLTAEYYDVVTAADGLEALRIAGDVRPDIILLDVMMPGIDGYEVCRRLKGDPELNHIPVVMVTALDAAADRIRSIDAGADDFLTKSINDVALFARVRSLLRMKLALDELRLRDNISLQFGALDAAGADDDNGAGGRILVVENEPFDRQLIENVLADKHHVICVASGEEAQAALTETFDLIIVSVDLGEADGLRVCSHLRSRDETRNVSLLMLSTRPMRTSWPRASTWGSTIISISLSTRTSCWRGRATRSAIIAIRSGSAATRADSIYSGSYPAAAK